MSEPGSAVVALAAHMGKVWVPPHVGHVNGRLYRVKGYWRGGLISTEREKRPSANVDFKDRRTPGQGVPKVKINPDALDAAMKAVGVKPGTKIKVRLKEGHHGSQGLTQKVGPDEYRITVYLHSGHPELTPHILYIVNNSLLHELRHVTQHQENPYMSKEYQELNETVGYGDNKFEVDARKYGRLAQAPEVDPTPLKPTGEAGDILGTAVWAIVPADPAVQRLQRKMGAPS